VTPRVNIPIALGKVSVGNVSSHPSFDIYVQLENITIIMTCSGYYATLRINDTTAFVENLEPLNLSSVYLSVTSRHLSTNALILTLQIDTGNRFDSLVDVGITADINFDGWDNAPCTTLAGRRGFTVHSPTNAPTFITQGYPFVMDVSTFWFGWSDNLTADAWAQVTEDSFSDHNSAIFVHMAEHYRSALWDSQKIGDRPLWEF
jgi:hypothetical protein